MKFSCRKSFELHTYTYMYLKSLKHMDLRINDLMVFQKYNNVLWKLIIIFTFYVWIFIYVCISNFKIYFSHPLATSPLELPVCSLFLRVCAFVHVFFLFIHLFCFLNSTYECDHMVFVFLILHNFT